MNEQDLIHATDEFLLWWSERYNVKSDKDIQCPYIKKMYNAWKPIRDSIDNQDIEIVKIEQTELSEDRKIIEQLKGVIKELVIDNGGIKHELGCDGFDDTCNCKMSNMIQEAIKL